MNSRLLALIFLLLAFAASFLAACSPPATTPTPDADTTFWFAYGACRPKLNSLQAVLASPTAANICTDYLVDVAASTSDLKECWAALPIPTLRSFRNVRDSLIQAATLYRVSADELSDYCDTGSDQSLDAATDALNRANDILENIHHLLDLHGG
ncbi:hypothetical protein ACFLT5_01995 [Chloroflexota bacterium]